MVPVGLTPRLIGGVEARLTAAAGAGLRLLDTGSNSLGGMTIPGSGTVAGAG